MGQQECAVAFHSTLHRRETKLQNFARTFFSEFISNKTHDSGQQHTIRPSCLKRMCGDPFFQNKKPDA
jgi:hypothetical protein